MTTFRWFVLAAVWFASALVVGVVTGRCMTLADE